MSIQPPEPVPVSWLKPDLAVQPCLVLAETDSVAVALRPLNVGENVAGVVLRQSVPKGHKIALRSIATGEPVFKYSQVIGVASRAIEPGDHVHSDNLAFRATEVAYESGTDLRPVVRAEEVDHFQGYRRADGRVGTRNYLAIISSVNCSATASRAIAAEFDAEALASFPNVDGVVALTHGTGCGMADSGEGWENLQRVLAGHALHPNVGGVLFLGLGCEVSQIQRTLEQSGLTRGARLKSMNIQGAGGHRKTVEKGRAAALEMLPLVNAVQREPCEAAHLMLALQCGGSDAWSGITANPALGHAADLLVAQGGTAVLAETPEIYGAEHLLTRRAVSPEVSDALLERIRWWQDYVARNHGTLDNNPSPGNKLGGLTTILEKSLGAVAKGGTTPLTGVFRYGERVDRAGFVFMDSPGYDPASVTGEVAGGCNLVAFTTGRGSTFGCKPAPSLKIATNSDTFRNMPEDMDIDAGVIVTEGASITDVGSLIYRRLLEVASGQPTFSERNGLGDNEFVPWQIGATL